MPLPILSTHSQPSDADLIRLFHRTELHWAQHLGESTTLDVGTAITNSTLNRVWDANQIRDVSLPEDMTPEQALAMVSDHYASLGTECRRCTINPGAPADRSALLRRHLLALGYTAGVENVMHLSSLVLRNLPEVPGLRIIPARASYKHLRQLAQERAARWATPEHPEAVNQLVQGFELHLDDPHWDALLALRDGQPIAFIGVLAVGEVGRIEDVFVSQAARRQGIGRIMMNRAIEICARSLFKHVMLNVLPDNAPAIALYRQFGFKKIGQAESLYAPSTRYVASLG